VVVLTSTALALSGLALTGVALGSSAASASDSGMFGDVNASRAAKGLPAYSWNSHLADVAGEQAARMAKQTKLYHNPNLASDVGNYRWVGENVGYGPTSDSIEDAFMKSPAHKANILDDNYTQIGIASVRDDNGRLWVAQVFRQPSGSSSSSSSKSTSSSTTKKKKPKAPSTTSSAPTLEKAKKKRATSTSSNATAPRSTPTPTPKPVTPKATPTRPAPEPTLADRVSYATSSQTAPATDPLADALAFAATMNAVGG
jgi:hypothetical protein